MSADLFRLVYYSRNRVAGSPETIDAEIRAILATSRHNNVKAGVTGALLFNSGCFGQVLEGTAAAVETTFERIQCDPRHGDVSLLAFEPAESRAFGNWSMAFVGSDDADAATYGDIADDSGFDPSRLTADKLFGTLRRLALEEERRAA